MLENLPAQPCLVADFHNLGHILVGLRSFFCQSTLLAALAIMPWLPSL